MTSSQKFNWCLLARFFPASFTLRKRRKEGRKVIAMINWRGRILGNILYGLLTERGGNSDLFLMEGCVIYNFMWMGFFPLSNNTSPQKCLEWMSPCRAQKRIYSMSLEQLFESRARSTFKWGGGGLISFSSSFFYFISVKLKLVFVSVQRKIQHILM